MEFKKNIYESDDFRGSRFQIKFKSEIFYGCKFYSSGLVFSKVDSTIQRINHYPADKYYQNQWSYPVDSDLTSG